ncbi:MAG: protein translocase subunit SecD [Clostridia bacterium]|nr:protein translocase subunit SecD [Clostridia bacterium]
MKKLMAVLKLVLVLLITAVLGWFIMQEPEIEYKVKVKEEKVTEETADEETEAEDKEEVTEETTEETTDVVAEAVEEEENYETKSFKNNLSYKNIDLGLDLAGGVSVVYEAETDEVPSTDDMNSAIALLRQRLTLGGNTEAEVSQQGENRIRVEMPGVSDPQQAVKEVGQTAELKFYGVKSGNYYPVSTGEASNYVIIDSSTSGEEMKFYTGANVSEIGELIVSGTNISSAYATKQQTSNVGGTEPVVVLEFDSTGTEQFAKGTHDYLQSYIAICLDDTIISCPSVSVEIVSGQAIITGMESLEAATTLANLINSGSLPFRLTPIETNIIGARLGTDALSSSIKAGLIGLSLVAIYMIIIYLFPGVVADIALCVYMVLVMAVLALFNITLTLPGIAGIILSVGMAVDANVIIFTRIKEELDMGKTLNSAIETGFDKAKSAIIDGNVTTLIVAAILYAKGIGSIRGFAETLALGIVTSMITALIVTKFILKLFVAIGCTSPKIYGVFKKQEVTTKELNKKHGKKD